MWDDMLMQKARMFQLTMVCGFSVKTDNGRSSRLYGGWWIHFTNNDIVCSPYGEVCQSGVTLHHIGVILHVSADVYTPDIFFLSITITPQIVTKSVSQFLAATIILN